MYIYIYIYIYRGHRRLHHQSQRGIALEFSFTCSMAPTYITPAAAKDPYYLTSRAEKDKITKHSPACTLLDIDFCPIGLPRG